MELAVLDVNGGGAGEKRRDPELQNTGSLHCGLRAAVGMTEFG